METILLSLVHAEGEYVYLLYLYSLSEWPSTGRRDSPAANAALYKSHTCDSWGQVLVSARVPEDDVCMCVCDCA